MNSRLPNIQSIHFVRISKVLTFSDIGNGIARISVPSWTKLPSITGSTDFDIKEKREKGNTVYVSELTTGIKEIQNNVGPVLVKLEFESGEKILIGEPDFPVIFEQTQNLLKKGLTFEHKSGHYPYLLQ